MGDKDLFPLHVLLALPASRQCSSLALLRYDEAVSHARNKPIYVIDERNSEQRRLKNLGSFGFRCFQRGTYAMFKDGGLGLFLCAALGKYHSN